MVDDGREGRRRKKKGMDLAAKNAGTEFWAECMKCATWYFEDHFEALVSDFRMAYPDLNPPNSCNAWGSLPKRLKNLGIVEITNRYDKPRLASRHNSPSHVLRSLIFRGQRR